MRDNEATQSGSDREDHGSDRRTALRGLIGLGALGAASPLLGQYLPSLITPAFAQANRGGQRGDGDLVFISAEKAETVPMAEWETDGTGAEASNSPMRFANGPEAVAKAPANASHYEAKSYTFPSGAIRVLTFPKGGAVLHHVTFETEVFILKGSVTLSPLYGFSGQPVKLTAGDALFLPAGVLSNPKASEETVLVTAIVNNTAKGAKAAIVRGHDVKESLTVQDGKDFTASKPEDIKKAPPGSAHFTVKRYVGDGNSFRLAVMKKGGRTNSVTNNRVDVLMYIAKGRMNRVEGTQKFEVKAGDVVREKMGDSGYWELLEDSVFLATDAPLNPANYSPSMIAR